MDYQTLSERSLRRLSMGKTFIVFLSFEEKTNMASDQFGNPFFNLL